MTRRWMIDFDGVVADLQSAFVASCNDRFSTTYTTDEIDSWHWWSTQPRTFSKYVWQECYPDRAWMADMVKPFPDAVAALADLATDGELAEAVMIVSARPRDHTARVQSWLYDQLPLLGTVPVLCVGTTYPKARFCEIHHLTTIVEDGAHNLRQMGQAGTQFLVERPWNRQEIMAPWVSRVSGLQGAIDAVTEVTV